MKLSEDIAFVLHEQWRQTRLREDGSYEPRWKNIKDESFISEIEENDLPSYLRKAENGYEIDIANSGYTQLSADWQNENKAAAEVVAKIVESGEPLSRNEIGEIIHDAWLERNSWAKEGELGVPFAELSKEEQDKDMIQYDVALTMSQAEPKGRFIETLDGAAKFLAEAKENGQNIIYEFNGHALYSEFDTPDTCYLKVCGMTVEETRIANQKRREEYQKINAKKTEEAIAKLPELKERGEKLIYPEKKESWNNCIEARAEELRRVETRAGGLEDELDLDKALEVMEALEQGKSLEESSEIARSGGHSGVSWSTMMSIVTAFSKQGPDFYRANNEKITPKIEEYLQKLERENKLYEELSKETGPTFER